jgi:hypothetical protein
MYCLPSARIRLSGINIESFVGTGIEVQAVNPNKANEMSSFFMVYRGNISPPIVILANYA